MILLFSPYQSLIKLGSIDLLTCGIMVLESRKVTVKQRRSIGGLEKLMTTTSKVRQQELIIHRTP